MENSQLELGFELNKYVPVIYKNEWELSNFSGLAPTLLLIGATFYMMRRASGMMGGGKKGGGLFGNVMQSPAKMVNPNEINVRFK